MAKRIADKELTDRNWDQEEEGEEVSPQEMTAMTNNIEQLMGRSPYWRRHLENSLNDSRY